MKPLPKTENPLVLRTDFSDQSAWERICRVVRKPYGKFGASLEFVDDVGYEGMTTEHIMSLDLKEYPHSLIILADRIAISKSDHPLLVIDLCEESGDAFRAIPSQIHGIEANLTLANMSFYEFADHVDQDGIFRGHPMPWYVKLLMKITGLDA